MIFQTYQTLSDVNTSAGLHTVFVYVNTLTSGLFSRMLLLSIFLVIAIGSYLSQLRTSGQGNLAGSFAVASFITFGASILMSFIDGLVTSIDIGVVLGITIISGLWFLTSNTTN